MDDMKKFLRDMDGKMLRDFDQKLMELKCAYDGLDEKEKEEFKAWANNLAAAAEIPTGIRVLVEVYIDNTAYDHEGEPIYQATARLSPKAIVNAINAWDNGEEYAPKGALETL